MFEYFRRQIYTNEYLNKTIQINIVLENIFIYPNIQIFAKPIFTGKFLKGDNLQANDQIKREYIVL